MTYFILFIFAVACSNDKIEMIEDEDTLPEPSKSNITFNTNGGSETITTNRDFEIFIQSENEKINIKNTMFDVTKENGVITELKSDWLTVTHPLGSKTLHIVTQYLDGEDKSAYIPLRTKNGAGVTSIIIEQAKKYNIVQPEEAVAQALKVINRDNIITRSSNSVEEISFIGTESDQKILYSVNFAGGGFVIVPGDSRLSFSYSSDTENFSLTNMTQEEVENIDDPILANLCAYSSDFISGIIPPNNEVKTSNKIEARSTESDLFNYDSKKIGPLEYYYRFWGNYGNVFFVFKVDPKYTAEWFDDHPFNSLHTIDGYFQKAGHNAILGVKALSAIKPNACCNKEGFMNYQLKTSWDEIAHFDPYEKKFPQWKENLIYEDISVLATIIAEKINFKWAKMGDLYNHSASNYWDLFPLLANNTGLVAKKTSNCIDIAKTLASKEGIVFMHACSNKESNKKYSGCRLMVINSYQRVYNSIVDKWSHMSVYIDAMDEQGKNARRHLNFELSDPTQSPEWIRYDSSRTYPYLIEITCLAKNEIFR